MSPLSSPVLIGTVVVGSPALWAAQVTRHPLARRRLVRLLICLAGVWAACSVVESIAESTVAANKQAEEARRCRSGPTTPS